MIRLEKMYIFLFCIINKFCWATFVGRLVLQSFRFPILYFVRFCLWYFDIMWFLFWHRYLLCGFATPLSLHSTNHWKNFSPFDQSLKEFFVCLLIIRLLLCSCSSFSWRNIWNWGKKHFRISLSAFVMMLRVPVLFRVLLSVCWCGSRWFLRT